MYNDDIINKQKKRNLNTTRKRAITDLTSVEERKKFITTRGIPIWSHSQDRAPHNRA